MIHQLLDLEGLEQPERQSVLLGVEQLPHRAVDRVGVERVLDLAHLHAGDKIGERAAAALRPSARSGGKWRCDDPA
jgi:hypothetical protein